MKTLPTQTLDWLGVSYTFPPRVSLSEAERNLLRRAERLLVSIQESAEPVNVDGAAGNAATLGAHWIRELLAMERRDIDGGKTINLARD